MRHVDGWRDRPCQCQVCRAERIFNRTFDLIAFIAVLLAILYYGGQIAAAALAGRL